jgi:hypothetical protein
MNSTDEEVQKGKRTIGDFIPAIAAGIVSLVTLIIYLTLYDVKAFRTFQIFAAPLIALIVPLCGRLLKCRIPTVLNIYVAIQAVLALDFAAALDFYHLVLGFDKVLHTSFGVLGCMIMFVFMLHVGGERLNSVALFAIIIMSVMGLGALWEIFEYTCDQLMGSNAQVWMPSDVSLSFEEYLAQNGSPLTDTMWDLIVTFIGSIIFCLLVGVDRVFNFKICRQVYAQIKGFDITELNTLTIDNGSFASALYGCANKNV